MASKYSTLTADVLRSKVRYDAETGEFFGLSAWSTSKPLGCLHNVGYTQIHVAGRTYLAHRLAWMWVHGEWPTSDIDHIDGNKRNNAWSNLRCVSHSCNLQNQKKAQATGTSGFLGVSFHKRRGMFRATILVNEKHIHLGYFSDPSAAHEAYVEAKRELHEGCTI